MIKLSAFSDEASKDLKGQIEALCRNDIRLTDVRSIDGINVKDMSQTQAKEYSTTLKNEGILVHMIGSPLGKVDISIERGVLLDTTKHLCEIAKTFGSDKIRMFSFYNAYNEVERVFELLCLMVEVAKEYSITLCHENEKDIYGDTLDRVCEIMEKVKGLKFIYDPANYIQVGEAPLKTKSALVESGLSDFFHIKDVIWESGEIVPAGKGSGLIPEILSEIKGDTVLTLEPHLKVFDAYASIDGSELKTKYSFGSNDEAFDAACLALKGLLISAGYINKNGIFVRKEELK